MSASGVLWLLCADHDGGQPRFHSMRATVAIGLLLNAARREGMNIDADAITTTSPHLNADSGTQDDPVSWVTNRLDGFGPEQVSWPAALGLVSDQAWYRVGASQSRHGRAEPVPRGLLDRLRTPRYRPTRQAREAQLQRITALLAEHEPMTVQDRDVLFALLTTGAADHGLSDSILPRRGTTDEVRAALDGTVVALADDLARRLALVYTGWFPGGAMSLPGNQ